MPMLRISQDNAALRSLDGGVLQERGVSEPPGGKKVDQWRRKTLVINEAKDVSQAS